MVRRMRRQRARPNGAAAAEGREGEERVLFARRRSAYVLLRASWPLPPLGAALAALQLWGARGGPAPLVAGASVALAGALGLLLLRWVALDLARWLARTYILTDRRLIEYAGVFKRERQQVALAQVQQVRVERPGLLAMALGLGDVLVVSASPESDLRLVRVRGPRALADAIMDHAMDARGRPMRASAPTSADAFAGPIADPILDALPAGVRAVVERAVRMDGGMDGDAAGDAPPRRLPVRLFAGERVVAYLHRHWIVFLRGEAGPLGLILAGSVGALALGALGGPRLGPLAVVALLACFLPGLLWGVGGYINYIDDVFILTTDRIIDVDRRYFFLAEARKETTYDKVQDVRASVSPLGRILGYGALSVETAGRLPDIEMRQIPRPHVVQDQIFARINGAKGRAGDAAASRRGGDYSRVMATALGQLLVAAPDVRGLGVLAAGERMRALGLRLVVEGQRAAPGVPPGRVIAQAPGDGAAMVRGGEVRVVLSGRAASASPSGMAAPGGAVGPPAWPGGA